MINKHQNIISKLSLEQKIKLVTGNGLWKTADLSEFGIAPIVMTDGTYGVRYSRSQIDGGEQWSMTDFMDVVNQNADNVDDSNEAFGGVFGQSEPATCFPNGCCVGNSWDSNLLYEMGNALANECKHYGVDILLGPGINIRRTPLAGRGYEYYSEDPVVNGDLAAALIKGLQDKGVGTSLKHFACNNSEYKRTEMDSIVPERALREIYLSGYKRVLDKVEPWTMMSSYNRLNGEQTAESQWLLNGILRREWGYNGLVMSDWYGIKDRAKSLMAGNDLGMPESKRDKRSIQLAIESGEIPEQALNDACLRVLALIDKVKAGREIPYHNDFKASHKLAQKIAAESIVLLKNECNTLPITPDKYQKIAVIGSCAQKPVIQGSGCATTRPFMMDYPLDEILETGSDTFAISYQPGLDEDGSCCEKKLKAAKEAALEADVAILFVSTEVGADGENGDRANLNLIAEHENLIEEITSVNKNVVVVIANSDAVIMPWAERVNAIVDLFFAGQGMGKAVSDILFGVVNPSGKLTVTIPNSLEETPAFLSYPGEGLKHFYSEGVFVGYRYYDKRKQQPLFPFGHGLSYTQFEYKNLTIDKTKLEFEQSVKVSVDVENTGKIFGKEVVQVYVNPPVSTGREVQSLKAFAKVSLEPGETKTIEFELSWEDFCYYCVVQKSWVAEKGVHQVIAAQSSQTQCAVVEIDVVPQQLSRSLPIDATLVELMEHPILLEQVVDLISGKLQLEKSDVIDILEKNAPALFCGMAIAFSELLMVDLDEAELAKALVV